MSHQLGIIAAPVSGQCFGLFAAFTIRSRAGRPIPFLPRP
jgi:hypothetical protein